MSSVVQASASPPRLHLDHVEGMRALAALTVYLNHAYAQSGWPGRDPDAVWFISLLDYSMLAGHLSVSVFIVLSGFCLALPVADNETRMRGTYANFMRRRARRILPPYYAALILSLGLIATIIGDFTGTLWDVPVQLDANAVIAHFLLVQDLFGTGKVNYVFWSIAVEWQIYFLFPLYLWSARRWGLWQMVLGALVLGYALRFGFDGTRLDRANPHFIGLFALGIAAAHAVRSPKGRLATPTARRVRVGLLWGLLVLVCAMCYGFGTASAYEAFPFLDLPVGLLTFVVLLVTSTDPANPVTRLCRLRPLVFVGSFSYSLYLLHAPVLQVLWQYPLHSFAEQHVAMLAMLLSVGLVAVLAASYLFHLTFEKPFMTTTRSAPSNSSPQVVG